MSHTENPIDEEMPQGTPSGKWRVLVIGVLIVVIASLMLLGFFSRFFHFKNCRKQLQKIPSSHRESDDCQT